MQALVYTDTETLIYKEEENPKLVNGESIIKVSASGICGSDMHAYHGHDNRRIPPLILGHEISGVIDKGKDIGKKVVPQLTDGTIISSPAFNLFLLRKKSDAIINKFAEDPEFTIIEYLTLKKLENSFSNFFTFLPKT